MNIYKLALLLRRHYSRISPMQMIAVVFLAIILFGGFLLSLPLASRSGQWTSYLSSVFTATSATCVTGLTIYDTFTHWSNFGQVVLLVLTHLFFLLQGYASCSALFAGTVRHLA